MNTDSRRKASELSLVLAALCSLSVLQACEKQQATAPEPAKTTVSQVEVQPAGTGPLVIKTPNAEFDVTSHGYVQAFLLRDGKRLTLDEPAADAPGGSVTLAGKSVSDFTFDLGKATVANAVGKLGALGK